MIDRNSSARFVRHAQMIAGSYRGPGDGAAAPPGGWINRAKPTITTMQVANHKPIAAPFAWKGADLRHRTDWIPPFRPEEPAELDAALQGVKRRGLDRVVVARED